MKASERRPSWVQSLGAAFAGWAQRTMPDPFVLALLLTLVAFLAALSLTPATPVSLVADWAGGLWGFLGFAMQMALVLVTGHAIASAPPVLRLVHRLAERPRTGGGAIALTAAVSGLMGLVNWGLALIFGAYLAREMGRRAEARGLAVHYPLLGAAGYMGMLVWHGGLSASAPLLMASAERDLVPEAGVVPIAQTILSPGNLVLSLAVLAVATLLLRAMSPKDTGRVVGYGEATAGAGLPPAAAGPDEGGDGLGPWANGILWLASAGTAGVLGWITVRHALTVGLPMAWAMVAVNALTITLLGRHLGGRLVATVRGGFRPTEATIVVAALLFGAAAAFLLRLRESAFPPFPVAAAIVVGVYGGARIVGRRWTEERATTANALDEGAVLTTLFGLAALGYLQYHFAVSGFGLDLNTMILAFLAVGLLLRGTPKGYVSAIGEATPGTAGIVLQFPFYAGILALMAGSGLLAVVAGGMVAASDATVFPILAFLSAGLVNVFVPSGGGQWAVQGPIVLEAASALGISLPKAVMAVAYGDQWTNMLQPFWALPLLGITGLKAKDIVGYTMVVMLATGPIFVLGLLLW